MSRISQRPMRVEEVLVPCQPLRMEISLDSSSEASRMETLEQEQNHETLKEENKEFHDAQEGKEQDKTQELKLSKTQQKRRAKKLHRLGRRLQNQQNKTTAVHTVQVNEEENDVVKGNDLQERENFAGKNGFLSWVEAEDCVKDKILGNYAIQLVEIDTKDKQPIQPKINHYQ